MTRGSQRGVDVTLYRPVVLPLNRILPPQSSDLEEDGAFCQRIPYTQQDLNDTALTELFLLSHELSRWIMPIMNENRMSAGAASIGLACCVRGPAMRMRNA